MVISEEKVVCPYPFSSVCHSYVTSFSFELVTLPIASIEFRGDALLHFIYFISFARFLPPLGSIKVHDGILWGLFVVGSGGVGWGGVVSYNIARRHHPRFGCSKQRRSKQQAQYL
jgi:hypothetical protein